MHVAYVGSRTEVRCIVHGQCHYSSKHRHSTALPLQFAMMTSEASMIWASHGQQDTDPELPGVCGVLDRDKEISDR